MSCTATVSCKWRKLEAYNLDKLYLIVSVLVKLKWILAYIGQTDRPCRIRDKEIPSDECTEYVGLEIGKREDFVRKQGNIRSIKWRKFLGCFLKLGFLRVAPCFKEGGKMWIA